MSALATGFSVRVADRPAPPEKQHTQYLMNEGPETKRWKPTNLDVFLVLLLHAFALLLAPLLALLVLLWTHRQMEGAVTRLVIKRERVLPRLSHVQAVARVLLHSLTYGQSPGNCTDIPIAIHALAGDKLPTTKGQHYQKYSVLNSMQ